MLNKLTPPTDVDLFQLVRIEGVTYVVTTINRNTNGEASLKLVTPGRLKIMNQVSL